MRKGFTLIELLIVVGIIGILAAIAIPNFLEAQTRAKASRVKAEFRTVALAVETYATDNSKYPPSFPVQHVSGTYQYDLCLWRLTTPVAYLTSVSLPDPFGKNMDSTPEHTRPIYMYYNYEPVCPTDYRPIPGDDWTADWANMAIRDYLGNDRRYAHRAYVLWSPGPDRHDNNLYWCDYADGHTLKLPIPAGEGTEHRADDHVLTLTYDPTNGTNSRGDMARLGGQVRLAALPLK